MTIFNMYAKCALTILLAVATIGGAYSVTVEKPKYEFVKPSTVPELPEERRSATFKEQPRDSDNENDRDSDKSDRLDSEKTKDPGRQDKQSRTILPTPGTTDGADNPLCCGPRYEAGSQNRADSGPGKSGGLRASSEVERYPSRYGSHPEDRHGWQSFNPGSPARRGSVAPPSSGSDLYGGGSGGDRYGTKRPYYGGENNYDGPNGGGNRPGRPGYGYGGNGYSDSGAYGSNGYELSRPGGGYGSRPPDAINFSGGRPGTYVGGPGIYGTIGEQEAEFPPPDEGQDPVHPHPGVNLQTQKAVALKALAGVALIGAAAALATNPVLLPIGVLAGRRKRSIDSSPEIGDIDAHTIMKLLDDRIPKIYREKLRKEIFDSPTCVARVVCEIQQEYETERSINPKDDARWLNVYDRIKKYLVNLLQRRIFDANARYKNIKEMMKSAEVYNGNCNVFVCDFKKD